VRPEIAHVARSLLGIRAAIFGVNEQRKFTVAAPATSTAPELVQLDQIDAGDRGGGDVHRAELGAT